MTASGADRPTVAHDASGSRYTINAGGEPAGFTEYVDQGDQRVFVHTVVDDAFAGQGLGSVLARFALDDTRSTGKRIVPICPFIAAFVARHHDWDAVIDKPTLRQVTELTR
ncbi:GNAT family N-acetyltransferase [Glaciibacter sp. 2TAF33]|uniref:GNAT family N-acetyltransferase n=1 Tax=Glaciibacter sp. 2TAF33 TaxID=3233015 RepID=UPI003F8F7C0E